MKKPLISLVVVALGLSVSCKEKSEEVKQVEKATADAVATGKITEDQAKAVNKVAEKADEIKDDALEMANKHLKALEEATTPEQLRTAIKDTTKANVDLAVKSGMMVKEQADLTLQSLNAIDQVPESDLQQMAEQLKANLKQIQAAQGK